MIAFQALFIFKIGMMMVFHDGQKILFAVRYGDYVSKFWYGDGVPSNICNGDKNPILTKTLCSKLM